MNTGNETFAENTRRMIEHGNKNAAALIEASKIAAGGAEEIAQELARCLTTSMEDGLATSTALFGCKDPKEAVALQVSHARKSMDVWLSEGAKLSELSLKTMTAAWTPLTAQFNGAMERMARPSA